MLLFRSAVRGYTGQGIKGGPQGRPTKNQMHFKLLLLLVRCVPLPVELLEPSRHAPLAGAAVGLPHSRGQAAAAALPQRPSRQMGFFFTMLSDTLWPNRSRMLSMLRGGGEGRGGGHKNAGP